MASTLKTLFVLISIVALSAAQDGGLPGAPVPCEGECPDVLYQHYFAKGCKAIFDDEVSTCCPANFDCTNIVPRKKDVCYYQEKEYAQGETIPVENPCRKGCFCGRSFDGWAVHQCANVECPALFNSQLNRCARRTYSVDKCCPEYSECPGEETPPVAEIASPVGENASSVAEIASPVEEVTETTTTPSDIFTCDVDDKSYNVGDQIYPDTAPCQICICTTNFTDIHGEGCRAIDCGILSNDRSELEKGCTPVYFKGGCCQIDWICPDSETIDTNSNNVAQGDETSSTHCTMGTVVAPVNGTMAVKNENMFCFCATPPDFSCVQFTDAAAAQAAKDSGDFSP